MPSWIFEHLAASVAMSAAVSSGSVSSGSVSSGRCNLSAIGIIAAGLAECRAFDTQAGSAFGRSACAKAFHRFLHQNPGTPELLSTKALSPCPEMMPTYFVLYIGCTLKNRIENRRLRNNNGQVGSHAIATGSVRSAGFYLVVA